MIYSIECCFSPEVEQQIKELWKQLKQKEICNFMTDTHAHPHISLAVFHSMNRKELHNCLQIFVQQQSQFNLTLSEIGFFKGEEGVIYIAPKHSQELIILHRQLYERIQNLSCYEQMWTLYQPKVWKAHCTMGIHLSEEKLTKALNFMQQKFIPLSSVIDQLILVEYDEKMKGRVCETYLFCK